MNEWLNEWMEGEGLNEKLWLHAACVWKIIVWHTHFFFKKRTFFIDIKSETYSNFSQMYGFALKKKKKEYYQQVTICTEEEK